MKLIKSFLLFGLIVGFITLQSCGPSTETTTTQGDWVKSAPFEGVPRTGLITFTIGEKVYAGLGYNGNGYQSDFYVLEGGIWTALASFPQDLVKDDGNDRDNLRERATAFSVGGNGYVGLGYNRDNSGASRQLNTFWKYDPAANKWTQLKDFPGGRRYRAVSVGIGENGYVGTGYDGTSWFGDFWKYTPGTDSWTKLVGFAGDKREGASAFVLNGKMILAGGTNNDLYIDDLWEFDPASASWTNRKPASNDEDFSDFKSAVRRENAVFFGFNNYAYMALGASPSLTPSIYELDPTTYKWTQKSNFEGSVRQNAIWFISGGKAYVGMGDAGSQYYDDIWEWRPLDESNID
jgi:N-acetylneuraminic acid mutarotase